MPAGYAATTGLESVFEDMYAAELYDLRVFEANAALGVFENGRMICYIRRHSAKEEQIF